MRTFFSINLQSSLDGIFQEINISPAPGNIPASFRNISNLSDNIKNFFFNLNENYAINLFLAPCDFSRRGLETFGTSIFSRVDKLTLNLLSLDHRNKNN